MERGVEGRGGNLWPAEGQRRMIKENTMILNTFLMVDNILFYLFIERRTNKLISIFSILYNDTDDIISFYKHLY